MNRVSYNTLFERYKDSKVRIKSSLYARWTLPKLMAELQRSSVQTTETLERDFQEMGAILVNNLSSKLAGLLFPQRPFFNIKASPGLKKTAAAKGADELALRSGLAKLELNACQQLFLNGSYAQLILALQHLIVTGNVLLYRDTDNQKSQAYGVQCFGVRRDGRGNVMDVILREYTDFESLSNAIQVILRAKHPTKYPKHNEGRNRVELFTRIKREKNIKDEVIYEVSQEADDVPVGTLGKYPEHLCPWQVPTWSLIPGEHYGRGLVEDLAGGMAKLSDLSHAATLYGIAASKMVNLVAPGQGADIDALNDAETGEYVQGDKDSVTTYDGGDGRKMEQLRLDIEAVFSRLAKAFMYKANTRDAERVTAFELKQDALEADAALGGVYSALSASMQTPLAHVLLTEVEPDTMEGIVTKSLKLDISAGIPALGRQVDVQNLAAAAQDAQAIIPVFAQLSNRVDKERVLDVILAGQSIDPSTIFKSKEQMAQEAQAQAQQAQGEQQIATSTTLADQAAQLQGLQQ